MLLDLLYLVGVLLCVIGQGLIAFGCGEWDSIAMQLALSGVLEHAAHSFRIPEASSHAPVSPRPCAEAADATSSSHHSPPGRAEPPTAGSAAVLDAMTPHIPAGEPSSPQTARPETAPVPMTYVTTRNFQCGRGCYHVTMTCPGLRRAGEGGLRLYPATAVMMSEAQSRGLRACMFCQVGATR